MTERPTLNDAEDLGALLLTLIAEVKALNIRVGALRELLHDHCGISDAQYDAAHATAAAASQLLDDGPKH